MPVNQLEADRRQELAEFLRSRRARLSPEEFGLPRGTRRRTPGLRREEVAMLAGVSTEWYTWLEQGRDINVSIQVLESLARVLQFDTDEREHLFLLAQRQPPPVESFSAPMVSATVQHFINQLRTSPASIVDARMNIVVWNSAHNAVFGDFSKLPKRERNLIWRIFTPKAQEVNAAWEKVARGVLARFRADYARFINDPWWAKHIEEMNRMSPKFRELWSHHDVINLSEGKKVLHHPVVGELIFDILWLETVDSSDMRLLIHTPRENSGTAEKVEQLLADAANKDGR